MRINVTDKTGGVGGFNVVLEFWVEDLIELDGIIKKIEDR